MNGRLVARVTAVLAVGMVGGAVANLLGWEPSVDNRRGRGSTVARPADYSMATDCPTSSRRSPRGTRARRCSSPADEPATQWADVAAETRFYIGARSPDYYDSTARDPVAVIR